MIAALVVSALLALPAVPAQADPPEVQITALSSGTLTSGQKATLKFRVTNKNAKMPPDNKDSVTIQVGSSFGELTCEGQCDFTDEIDREASKEYTVTLVAGTVEAGQTKSGQVRITARIGGDQGQASRDVTVRGPQPEVQTVKEVSGKVVDAKGDPVGGAIVGLLDSQQRPYSTTTNNTGNFRFTSSTGPITPGAIEIGASKDGEREVKTINARAGQSVTNLKLTLKLNAQPTASATPEATPEATEEAEATPEATEEGAQAAPQNASNEDSGGFGSWLLIIVGGLFVAVGVGTIVLLWMRRKEQGDGGDPADAIPPTRSGGGGYRGMDDQTRIVPRAAAGAGPTAGGPSLADAPTMMHNRPLVDDEFPDPYGAPLPTQQPTGPDYSAAADNWAGSGYGSSASGGRYDDAAPTQAGYGYGNAPASGGGGYGNTPAAGGGYGNAPASGGGGYGNAPASGGGGYGNRDYGAQSGGGYQGAQSGGYGERYDEPTGRYTGATEQYVAPADPYATGAYSAGDSGRGYGQDQSYGRGQEQTGGYGQGGGYGSGTSTGGYDSGQGYGSEQGYRSGGYGQRDYGAAPADSGGYDRTGGYDQPAGGGYDQRGGYDRTPEQRGGYDRTPEQRGGYDNRYEEGGYYGAPPQGEPDQQPPQHDRSSRRSLNWLDD
ncbi:DUF1416 domain-containing protein [Micromonospora echinofusca]|uniref:DUF1416 domain-containing protein n=1 Tax=Micromonospora echinofusca TaxID=47858 RepID=A0ABS3VLJ9_MICEH|nr:DUF1416 domain-containing protein [Micromonospora echinofusca]